MNIAPPQILLLSMTLLGCSRQTETSSTTQTTETSMDSAVTTETASATTTTTPGGVTVLSLSTSEGEMVTERVLTIELDGQTQVSVECSAETDFGDFEETHTITSSSPAVTHSLRLNGLLADTTYSCITVNRTLWKHPYRQVRCSARERACCNWAARWPPHSREVVQQRANII